MLDDGNVDNNKHHVQGSSTILIVDDNSDILRFMERGLKEHCFAVSAFTDPLMALEDIKINGTVCSLILY